MYVWLGSLQHSNAALLQYLEGGAAVAVEVRRAQRVADVCPEAAIQHVQPARVAVQEPAHVVHMAVHHHPRVARGAMPSHLLIAMHSSHGWRAHRVRVRASEEISLERHDHCMHDGIDAQRYHQLVPKIPRIMGRILPIMVLYVTYTYVGGAGNHWRMRECLR